MPPPKANAMASTKPITTAIAKFHRMSIAPLESAESRNAPLNGR
jgi:hypothetical protein